MQTARPPSHAFEHGRRGQIRRCLRKITSTIRGGGKDATLSTSIPQPTAETHEHSHNDALFDFSNIITADEPPTFDQSLDQSRPESRTRQFTGSSETFHIDRFSVYQERAQKLRSRYGVNVAGNSCSASPSTARRVQKSARMRVHRSCHVCGVDFGHGVLCRACHHRVCDDCPRAPGRRIQDAMGQARDLPFHLAADHPSSDSDSSPTRSPVVTQLDHMPSRGERTLNCSALSDCPRSSDGVGHLLEVDDEAFDNSPALLTRGARHGTATGLIPFLPRINRNGNMHGVSRVMSA